MAALSVISANSGFDVGGDQEGRPLGAQLLDTDALAIFTALATDRHGLGMQRWLGNGCATPSRL